MPSDYRPTADELARARRLSVAMLKLGRQSAAVASQLARCGVDKTSMMLLGTLAANGPMRSSALAEAVYSDPSTISRQVAALVKAGLVERTADRGDGRASLLAATDKGLRRIQEQTKRRTVAHARVTANWSAADQLRFVELLERFVAEHERSIPDFVAEFANQAGSEGES